MTTEVKYDFTAPITAKGKQRSGDGWTTTFAWKMPGSQYELVLYGKDWDQVRGWDIGDTPDVMIERGNLKKDKTGQYNTDYYWNLKSLEHGTGIPTAVPAPSNSGGAPPNTRGTPQDEFRRSKEEMRLLGCLQAAASFHGGIEEASADQAWTLAGIWYHDVTQWEAERVSNLTAPEWRDPRDGPAGTETPVERPLAYEEPYDPDASGYCAIQGHNNAPLRPVFGKEKKGHPVEGQICYG